MALSIKSDEADRLARALVAETGESLTEAVVVSLRERLERTKGRRSEVALRRLSALAEELGALPVVDGRHPNDIIGYDADGLPA
jgi:antitoxin VapB